jgi:hypothetical protein
MAKGATSTKRQKVANTRSRGRAAKSAAGAPADGKPAHTGAAGSTDGGKGEAEQKGQGGEFAAFRRVAKRIYCAMANRQPKVVNEQADRYKLPLRGATVDLCEIIKAFHDFLAANARRLAGPESGSDEDDPLLAGGTSPALERYRLVRAKREEFNYERDLERWVDRELLNRALGVLAAVLRQAGEGLQRQYGPEAQNILDEAIDDAVERAIATFADEQNDQHHDAKSPDAG